MYQKYAKALATELAKRYSGNKNISVWHINNEYGGYCYCDNCQNQFRVWLNQDGAAWKEAINKLNMTWPQMSDLKFWQSEGAQLYAVNSIPHTVLIDGSGKIIARGLHGEELQAKIAEAVK